MARSLRVALLHLAPELGALDEWEARTLETGLPLIVCNRTGRGRESHLADSESVIVDRGAKLLALRAPNSTVFTIDCELRDGHIATCEVAAALALTPD